MANRFSQYSNNGSTVGAPRSTAQQSTQVSTTTLLNTLHTIFATGQTYPLDASTSLAVNTWVTATHADSNGRSGGIFDTEMGTRAWEHAQRRAEDGCIVLGSLHPSTPSLFTPFLQTLPISTPEIVSTALNAVRPFLTCVTPYNASAACHSALAATYTVTLAGKLTSLNLAISLSGIDVDRGLLKIPEGAGYRAFDVFYYLLTAASTPAEREFLGLKPASKYSLLKKSGTYDPPSYLPAADDAASADDFRASLKAIGIKGSAYRGFLSALAALLKLGETTGFLIDSENLDDLCEDIGGLIGLEPEVLARQCSANDREVLIAGMYEALVDWILEKANAAISASILANRDSDSENGSGIRTPRTVDDSDDCVSITVIEVPGEALGKALAMRTIFNDKLGINAEMKEDGVEVIPAGHSVLKEMENAVADVEADLGISGGPQSREREHDHDRREGILERIGAEAEAGGFLRTLLYPVESEGLNFGKKGRFDLPAVLGSSRVWYMLSLHPTDDAPATLASSTMTASSNKWSAAAVSRQLRAWRLPEWANRRNKHLDFTADFDVDEFYNRYARLGCKEGKDGVESFLLERGWSNGEVVIGTERIWMREGAWWEAEQMLDLKHVETQHGQEYAQGNPFATPYSQHGNGSGFFPPMDTLSVQDSKENLLDRHQSQMSRTIGGAKSIAPTMARTTMTAGGDYGLGPKGDDQKDEYYDKDPAHYTGGLDPEFAEPKQIEKKTLTTGRRIWVAIVWSLTFWIPSFMLRFIGRMKRPDVRFAWREKLVLIMFIFLLNAFVVFYIVEFGRLLCPNWDKAWNAKEVTYHQGDNDFWVSIHGKVYDLSKFWKLQHSDTAIKTTADTMQPFAGQNLDVYFEPPLKVACPGFGIQPDVQMQHNDTTAVTYPNGLHTSGELYATDPTSALHSYDWYSKKFLPKIQEYYKGDLVVTTGDVYKQGQNDQRYWVIINSKIYDLTDYFYTLDRMNKYTTYSFLPDEVTKLFQNNPGTDITDQWGSNADFQNSLNCLNNAFYQGKTDFRKTPKCQVNNYILLAFTIILCTVILVKFLAALQFGSKRRPAAQDKFVICQVPAYTEGEDHLRKGLDSLTALQYDNKRKLICVICDGMIVGGGNDRPTPKIVLDILGVDPKIDPPALPFRSVGQGSEQLNYGKVYSGLYEYEGNVVPYIVVVKVGKESEQSKTKPGNRGKRDSQIMLMQFLNRVHHRSPMSPLELEIFHQINNIIGVDPELYEYLFMVDADTMVREDSLNRLVAACANDAKIAGICGETSLENEERSWWTMIQVYEYYISHHLAKAFESLFGSVTCLPGCFSMYRLRTADKGRPLIISDKVIQEYAMGDVDTLHKKNLLSLGEDRYLTTLMTKHFPSMSYKFIPDAYAQTAAPETWSVLLSQRRRWINSTIHNLVELVMLKDLCGFCCFSMRFVVFIDLFGTVILPATCVYLGYLLYRVGTHTGQFPLISLIMIAAVYGLQAIIFILKRQWQHVGWMIIYILAFPIYSFVLPVYSFWNQDNFTWGNTRIVIGEKGNKQIVAVEDEGFDPRSIPLQRWDDYAQRNNLPGRRGGNGGTAGSEKYDMQYHDDAQGMEMDDIHSTYSSVKPASTILNRGAFGGQNPYMVPAMSPGQRQSTYRDAPMSVHGRQMSMGNLSNSGHPLPPYSSQINTHQPQFQTQQFPDRASGAMSPYRDHPNSPYASGMGSLGGIAHSASRPSLLGAGVGQSRAQSSILDFRADPRAQQGPDDGMIVEAIQACLNEVDLDSVTKKQVRALVEQRLQTEIFGERRAFLDRAIDESLANM